MPSSRFLAVFGWIVLAVVFSSAVWWTSLGGLALQPPAPIGDCALDAVAASSRQPDIDAVRPRLVCQGRAVS